MADIDYYANPYFNLITFYHVIGPFSFILNSFGLYMVGFQTNKSIGEYRIHLFIHLTIGTIYEFYVCVLCCPRIYIPQYMGSTHGLLSVLFEVPTFYQQWLTFILMGTLLISCGHLAYFRANNILLNGTSYKLSQSSFLSLLSVVYLLHTIAVTFTQFKMKDEQDPKANALQFLIENPKFVSLHDPETASVLFYVDKSKEWAFNYLLFLGFFIPSLVIWNLISCSIMVYQITSKLISHQNAQKIKKYLIGVQLQILPCSVCYLIPACWMASCLVLNIEIPSVQVFNDLSCFFTVIQSPLSISVLFWMNVDYRQYLKSLLRLKNAQRFVQWVEWESVQCQNESLLETLDIISCEVNGPVSTSLVRVVATSNAHNSHHSNRINLH